MFPVLLRLLSSLSICSCFASHIYVCMTPTIPRVKHSNEYKLRLVQDEGMETIKRHSFEVSTHTKKSALMKLPSGRWTAGIKLKSKLNHNPFHSRLSNHCNCFDFSPFSTRVSFSSGFTNTSFFLI